MRNITYAVTSGAKVNVVAQDLWFCHSQSHGHYLDGQECPRSVVVALGSTTKSRLFVIRCFQKMPDTVMIYCSTGISSSSSGITVLGEPKSLPQLSSIVLGPLGLRLHFLTPMFFRSYGITTILKATARRMQCWCGG